MDLLTSLDLMANLGHQVLKSKEIKEYAESVKVLKDVAKKEWKATSNPDVEEIFDNADIILKGRYGALRLRQLTYTDEMSSSLYQALREAKESEQDLEFMLHGKIQEATYRLRGIKREDVEDLLGDSLIQISNALTVLSENLKDKRVSLLDPDASKVWKILGKSANEAAYFYERFKEHERVLL